MDWDLKVPAAWGLAEMEHDAGAAKPAAAGPSGGHANVATGCRPPGPECSVDLKLGGLGECEFGAALAADRREEPAAAGKAPAAAVASASSPGFSAAKRPRAPGGGGGAGHQYPSCAVDGCKADLGKCRDYHRRHKVCEAHSKTPVVVVAGREMRFCQQCSRFHLLAEFDEAKRSCRKRLDGHNRRRRKPQPDTMTSASFIASQQGTRFSPFTTPRPDANWPGVIKTEESPYYTHQLPLATSSRQHFVGSTSAYTKEVRRFPFQQEGEISFATGVVMEASVCQPLLKTVAPPESSSGSGSKMFSDGLTRVLESDCALSLLSAPANSSVIDVSRMVRPTEQVPMAQPLVSGLQFGSSPWFSRPPASTGAVSMTTGFSSCPVVESEQLNTVLSLNDNEMNYNGMFHVGGEGSSDGTSPSLPFSWQ
ncbi:teosinte glume architecture 1-like [Phragmites australis]|uniref:teosinte glume architecture 1-like n=1 Tax=Phragmites australis TaxID=29695 RepID=UPI002D77FDF1|nr:teosinte glume architecture 1-like [Phragmites australis]